MDGSYALLIFGRHTHTLDTGRPAGWRPPVPTQVSRELDDNRAAFKAPAPLVKVPDRSLVARSFACCATFARLPAGQLVSPLWLLYLFDGNTSHLAGMSERRRPDAWPSEPRDTKRRFGPNSRRREVIKLARQFISAHRQSRANRLHWHSLAARDYNHHNHRHDEAGWPARARLSLAPAGRGAGRA